MATAEDQVLAEEVMQCILSKPKIKMVGVMRKYRLLLLAQRCSHYREASFIYKLITEMLEGDTCNLGNVDWFLNTCGEDLTRFVTPEGATDSVGLFLDFWCRTKQTLREKGCTIDKDPHPINQNLYHRRYANIPLLLHHGLTLEFTENFYGRLQPWVGRTFTLDQQYSAWLKKNSQLSNQKRVFLVCLVLWTLRFRYTTMERQNMDIALRMIWRSIPDATLCRHEFFEVFAGFADELIMLEEISERYGKFICEGEFTELAQPRSLAHLSRCKIRQALSLNKEIPTGVSKLLLPKDLENYLLLKL